MDIMARLSREAERFEVFTLRKESTVVQFEANRLKSSSIVETRGTAVRAVRQGRLGFSASTEAGREDRLADKALESSAFGDPAPFGFAAPAPAPLVKARDEALSRLGAADLVAACEEMLAIVLPVDPLASARIWLERSLTTTRVRTGEGLDVSWESSPILIRFQIDRIDGDDVLTIVDQYGSTVWDGGHLSFAARLADLLARPLRVVKAGVGRMPALFSPSGALALTVPLCEALSGSSVASGSSPLRDRLGQRILDARIGIVDDGLLAGAFASAERDDEGTPRARTVLVEGGVLKGFVHDRRTAARLGAEPTGNASRGPFSPFYQPEPAFTNLALAPGDSSVKDMLAGMKGGIIVESALGLGMGNVMSGAFSNPLGLAFKVEGGEIVGRVKDLSIAGKVYETLGNVEAISRESQVVDGSTRLPHILVADLSVAGRG